ncbi:MAG: HPr family phosphocarrier protein [Eubacteriales bacterium]|nr:HPr family phosphocarrier protein [Eubacteriales bacterium]
MKKVTVKLIDPMGFHARPIAIAVNKLREYDCEGYVLHDGREQSMDSVVKLVEMEVPAGSTFMFGAEGKDEDEALMAIVDELKDIGFIE